MVLVTVVRVYFTEGEHKMTPLMYYLHEEARVKGVTVFRGIAGFGQSGTLHSSNLVDLSFDLPLVIEFFDTPERITPVMQHLCDKIAPGHIISWQAEMN